MDAKKSYIKQFFTSASALIIWLLISSFALTLIATHYEFGLLDKILKNRMLFDFCLLSAIAFIVIGCVWCAFSFKSKSIRFADSVYFSGVTIGILFAVYTICVKNLTQLTVSFSVVLIVIFGLLIIARSQCFNKGENTLTNANALKNYYRYIFDNYSETAIILGGILIVLVSFLALNFGFTFPLKSEKISLIIIGALSIPLLIYAVISTLSNKVTVFDAVMTSGAIAFPFVFIIVFTICKTESRQIFIGGIFVVYAVSLFMRYFRFNIESTLVADEKIVKNNCSVSKYFSKVFRKNGFLTALSSASLVAIATLVIFKTNALSYLYNDGKVILSFKSVIVALFILGALIPLIICAISSLVSTIRKSVVTADKLLVSSFFYCVFGYAVYFAHPSPLYLIGLSAFLLYTIILSAVRIKLVNRG